MSTFSEFDKTSRDLNYPGSDDSEKETNPLHEEYLAAAFDDKSDHPKPKTELYGESYIESKADVRSRMERIFPEKTVLSLNDLFDLSEKRPGSFGFQNWFGFETAGSLGPNRQASVGIGSGCDINLSVKDSKLAQGEYLQVRTDANGNMQVKLTRAEANASIETSNGTIKLKYEAQADKGWVTFSPDTETLCLGNRTVEVGVDRLPAMKISFTGADGTKKTLDAREELLLGRSVEGAGKMDGKLVERKHAKIVSDLTGTYITDFCSRSGVFVQRTENGSLAVHEVIPSLPGQPETRFQLKPGDVVWLGPPGNAESRSIDLRSDAHRWISPGTEFIDPQGQMKQSLHEKRPVVLHPPSVGNVPGAPAPGNVGGADAPGNVARSQQDLAEALRNFGPPSAEGAAGGPPPGLLDLDALDGGKGPAKAKEKGGWSLGERTAPDAVADPKLKDFVGRLNSEQRAELLRALQKEQARAFVGRDYTRASFCQKQIDLIKPLTEKQKVEVLDTDGRGRLVAGALGVAVVVDMAWNAWLASQKATPPPPPFKTPKVER